jgi:hypothetical protein
VVVGGEWGVGPWACAGVFIYGGWTGWVSLDEKAHVRRGWTRWCMEWG